MKMKMIKILKDFFCEFKTSRFERETSRPSLIALKAMVLLADEALYMSIKGISVLAPLIMT